MPDNGPVIGIDLGTTNSCVSVVIDGTVHVIPDESGARLQASLVACLEDGRLSLATLLGPIFCRIQETLSSRAKDSSDYLSKAKW